MLRLRSKSILPACTDAAFYAAFDPKDARIIEYAGQGISWEETVDDEDNPHTFIFGLGSGEVINPEIGGNEARWINHCCDREAFEETIAPSSMQSAT